ncbi:MAG: 50S ribosomal protein L29 [Myxococcota bacterium]
MKASEIRERTDEELTKLSAELRRELWKARFDNQINQLDDTSRIQQLRKDVARVETIISERAKSSAGAAQPAASGEGEQE